MIEEMIQWLKALTALAEGSGQFPAPTWWLTTDYTSVLGGPTPPSDRHRHACGTQTNIQTITYINK